MFHNSGKLFYFLLKTDRVKIAIWLLSFTLITVAVPVSFENLYPTQAERDAMSETMGNPAIVAMLGPGDFDSYTVGAMTSHEMILLTAVVVGLMNILLVNRHTRVDEEEGVTELIRSLPTGRGTNMLAVFFYAVTINGLLFLLLSAGLILLDIESIGAGGSLLYGSVLAGTGMLFAGLTAVTAQLTDNGRSSFGLAFGLLLVAYFVRAVGDVSAETLSLFSPLHMTTRAEVFISNQWWTLVPLFAGGGVLFVLAGYLVSIRDLDASFLPSRSGRAEGSPLLRTPLGLAFRLQLTGVISWAVAMLAVGGSYGSVLGDLESFFAGNEILQQMLPGESSTSFTEQFLSMLIVVIAIMATIPALMAMLKLYKEEKKGMGDLPFSKPLSRARFFFSYLLIAVVEGGIMVFLAFFGLWLAAISVMEDPLSFSTILGAGSVYLPAIFVMIGVSAVLIGFVPRRSGFVWGYLLYTFIVLYFGGLLQFPEWMEYLSPFGFIPELPNEKMSFAPVLILTGVSAVLVAVGFRGYQARDIEG
ncbi:ABC transporter permease [Salimicrobium sp. PL1-032A]|uniref:ABC transporter permease n=1 Tax=Salimicrobium sp. PL1-032A TaxID=3095364 RepID=UPI00326130E8